MGDEVGQRIEEARGRRGGKRPAVAVPRTLLSCELNQLVNRMFMMTRSKIGNLTQIENMPDSEARFGRPLYQCSNARAQVMPGTNAPIINMLGSGSEGPIAHPANEPIQSLWHSPHSQLPQYNVPRR